MSAFPRQAQIHPFRHYNCSQRMHCNNRRGVVFQSHYRMLVMAIGWKNDFVATHTRVTDRCIQRFSLNGCLSRNPGSQVVVSNLGDRLLPITAGSVVTHQINGRILSTRIMKNTSPEFSFFPAKFISLHKPKAVVHARTITLDVNHPSLQPRFSRYCRAWRLGSRFFGSKALSRIKTTSRSSQ